MTQPLASISGISSGIQWRDLVDQIMQVEATRRFDPLASRQSLLRSQGDAWRQFQGVAARFRDAARAMQPTAALDVFRASATRAGSGRELIAVSTGSAAQSGSYAVEVLATAQAEKVSGAVMATATTAVGIAGTLALNGRTVSVTTEDTLTTLRDKINATNTGASASGVSATIVAAGSGVRLVVAAQHTGASGIAITDDGSVSSALGFTDGSTVSNIGADGATRTQLFTSATASVASLLGVPLPTPSTIRIGDQTITINLEVDSLATIAAKIAAATGSADSARVVSERQGTTTRFRLETDLPVSIDPLDAVASARTLAVLGFTHEGRSNIAQVVAGAQAYGDQGTGLPATGTSLLSSLTLGGSALGIATGDTISIGGLRGDGTSVARQFTVAADSTLANLLAAIGDDATAFGAGAGRGRGGRDDERGVFVAGARPAQVALDNGRVVLTDGTAGDSALGLTLTLSRAGGGTASLGTHSTADGTVGRNRVVTAGSDALLRVDGQLVRRPTNTVTDAVPGLTISALAAETGTLTQVEVTRDTDAVVKLVQDFAAAYNALQSWVSTNTAAGTPLASSSVLRGMAQSISSALLKPLIGVSGPLTIGALAGLERDRSGVLSLNATTFRAALVSDAAAVRELFSVNGRTTDPGLEFITAGAQSAPTGDGYAVEITQVATQASVTGASFTTYATLGAPDTMSITDGATGRSADILLADGDDIVGIIQQMNSTFAAQGMRLTAARSVDNRIVLSAEEFGSNGGFTVAYTAGAGGDGTGALGIAAEAVAGLDVGGTINGVAGVGSGQILTGAGDQPAVGVAVRFTGVSPRSAGQVFLSLGIGGVLTRLADELAAESGRAVQQGNTATLQADAIDPRLEDIQKRLDARRDALIRQFIAMEGALAKSQALAAALTSQIDSLAGSSSSRR